ncbi:MAG: hypothetical protein LKI34_02900 [Bifidobacterium tibiigranuli]|jgi:hypothetical protein|uniref:hypothetical protein n=1 Tax=Bifidobacterium tibiigranuli TaxID=2172043 RepID=UPI0026EE5CB6|nr:hypothetical protein [Bifidobacterium tibiigranuli]MCI1673155.1 hypothetical protein [Bifidobacterium tibiigranuli]MCI1713600.1 hypothetical protein [Bifidobacterium tibiigranuli]
MAAQPSVSLHIVDEHGTSLAGVTVPVPLTSPKPGYMPMFDAARFDRLMKMAIRDFTRTFASAVHSDVGVSDRHGWDAIRPSSILGNRHLASCRQLNDDSPSDMALLGDVGRAYAPHVWFADGVVYADSGNLYGQVFQYDRDGQFMLRGDAVVSRFMRVPIPERMGL